ncbi:M48 family metallopeptidase [Deinococcus sp. S9]|uniref:M48 metallopeptidase family protein n=1 Tax=Deinococcus sp. S9 TaxID=2545754 RepID=UPI001F0FDB33|nr:M48 family metallopeptidase [Deinococcus sp. S9]
MGAGRELPENVADILGVRDGLRQAQLTNTQTRWGSCTAGGVIRLHWALARAPREVRRLCRTA